MTWEIKIQQSTVPFEIIVHKNIRDVPIPEFIFNLRWPPFLSVKTVPFSFGKLGDLTRFSTDTPNGRKLHNRIRQKYVRSGVRATIQYTSPKMKSGTFQLLLAKIACGFFYTARRDDFQASGLGLRLSERIYQPETRNFAPELQEVYSCPNEMFNLRVNEAARVCTICDVDGLHHYCMIKVLPEVFENTYFFRIPASVDMNEITSFSNDGTYRAWDGCLK